MSMHIYMYIYKGIFLCDYKHFDKSTEGYIPSNLHRLLEQIRIRGKIGKKRAGWGENHNERLIPKISA